MTNKEKIKKSINNDFNKEDNYKEIIKKIKGEQMKSKKLWKWSLVPICLVVLVSGSIFMHIKSNNKSLENNINYKEDQILNEKSNIKLNINNIKEAGALKFDADIKEISMSGVNIPWPEILKDGITIPKDLSVFKGYSIYTRKDKSGEYDILNCYVYNYSHKNDDNSRNIRIAFSDTNKPIRDYLFSDEGSKDTIIKDIKLKIYKYETIYFVEFRYKGYNFDIETVNITEQELLDLLISIIK